MSYRLSKDLSCCDVDGHLVFLDIAQDRYFRLTGDLEPSLRRFLANGSATALELKELVSKGILVEASDLEVFGSTTGIRRPSRSAMEQPGPIVDNGLNLATVFEVMAITWSTHRQLKTRTLKFVIDESVAYRTAKTQAQASGSTACEDSLLQATWKFTRARRYVPIEPICLLDSLSLLRFLSRRRMPANIVFGVTGEPFSAHCWVQAGDVVLNETLSDANAHTPIRMI